MSYIDDKTLLLVNNDEDNIIFILFNRSIISMKKGSYYRMTFTHINEQMGWISDVPTFIL